MNNSSVVALIQEPSANVPGPIEHEATQKLEVLREKSLTNVSSKVAPSLPSPVLPLERRLQLLLEPEDAS